MSAASLNVRDLSVRSEREESGDAAWHLRFASHEVEDLMGLEMVHHGVLFKARGPLRTTRVYFLFSDRLMTAEVSRGSRRSSSSSSLMRRKCFPLTSVRLRLSADDLARFDLVQMNISKATHLVAESASHRHAWIEAITRQLWAHTSEVATAFPLEPLPLYLAVDAVCRAAVCSRLTGYARGCLVTSQVALDESGAGSGAAHSSSKPNQHLVEGSAHSALLVCYAALSEPTTATSHQRAVAALRAALQAMPAEVRAMAEPALGGSVLHLALAQASTMPCLEAISEILRRAPELIDRPDTAGLPPLLVAVLRCCSSKGGGNLWPVMSSK